MLGKIRVLQGYEKQSDALLIASAGAVIRGLTGHAIFASPPVDLKTVQTAIDELYAAIAAQQDGGPSATAIKRNKRAALIADLNKLAHYVQDHCAGNPATVLSAGFTVASFTRASPPLDKPAIVGIDFGNARELVVRVNRVPRAKCYEVQVSPLNVGGSADEWKNAGLFTNSRAMTITGLTPGTTYAFQVRAVGGGNGYSGWSDSVAHICG